MSTFGPWPAPRNLSTYSPSSSASTIAGSDPPSRSGVTYRVAVTVRTTTPAILLRLCIVHETRSDTARTPLSEPLLLRTRRGCSAGRQQPRVAAGLADGAGMNPPRSCYKATPMGHPEAEMDLGSQPAD